MDILVKMQFGSHLYGTNTTDSDMDYKGIFMPSLDDILLGKISKSMNKSTGNDKSKNTSDDTDIEIYSLHYFLHLACEGETVALDMLHAPKDMIVESHPLWDYITLNRNKFYTKNLKAFIGYVRRQASKYGIKGSRLNDAKVVVDFLSNSNATTLKEVWDDLPEGEHIFKHDALPQNNDLRMYEICGRKIIETSKIPYALDIVKHFYDSYGARARQAANNENIDWKAVSHALRAAYQVQEILTEGIITFPLKEADYLKAVKSGKYDYTTEVAPTLDGLMDKVEALSTVSTLPMKADRRFWNEFIKMSVCDYYGFYDR